MQQEQETDNRKNWAAIGEAKSSSEDDKQHAAADGLDNSIQALREKNRSFPLSVLQSDMQNMQGHHVMVCVSSDMLQQLKCAGWLIYTLLWRMHDISHMRLSVKSAVLRQE